jgi:SAM-dependent methyltransferase
MTDPTPFYDDLADHYHLVYEDWEAAMARHGRALRALFGRLFPRWGGEEGLRILDAAAGIGTQSLAAAAAGHRVVARDLSQRAVERLRREAAAREVDLDVAVADLRNLDTTLDPGFDVVMAFDNVIPHLVQDDDIVAAFTSWGRLLRSGGSVLISVRNYDAVERGVDVELPYGERREGGCTYRLEQRWRWRDEELYDTTFVVEEEVQGSWVTRVETTALYRALSLRRLSELMRAGGLLPRRMDGVEFHQPVLAGRVG